MKRIICLLITVSVLLNVLPVLAKEEICYSKAELIQAGDFGGSQIIPSNKTEIQLYSAEDSVYQVLYEGLKNSQAEIDVERYGLKVADFASILSAVVNSSPDLFYVGN